MNSQATIAAVFVAVFAGIISEKLDKTLIVLLGACFLIIFGYIDFHHAIQAIDFNTICLLMGMMLLVETLRAVKLFDLISFKLGLFTKGNPILIFLVFSLATAFLSAFLDNVTTVLVTVPLVISITRSIGLDPKIFILSLIFLSNIGGTATLIGDPPNILIGSQVQSLTFGSFIEFLTPPVLISTFVILWYLKFKHPDQIKSHTKNFSWLFLSNLQLEQMKREQERLVISKATLIKACSVFGLVLLGFFTHAITGIEPSVVAVTGAVIMLILFYGEMDLHHLIGHIEWPTLLFFSGLFVIVGAMEHAGILNTISHALVALTTDTWLLIMVVLWASAILSGIVDNIPFVAVMIPILKDLMKSEPFANDPKIYLLWWALSLGACFGGNATMIGASANVVSCAIARGRGIEIGFKEFAKSSLPVTFISIVISSIYLSLIYFL